MQPEAIKPQIITRTFNYMGETVKIKIALPTNKEMNDHTAGRLKIDDDVDLIHYRAAMFDKHVVECSKQKHDIYEATKANVVFHLFENFSLDVKN